LKNIIVVKLIKKILKKILKNFKVIRLRIDVSVQKQTKIEHKKPLFGDATFDIVNYYELNISFPRKTELLILAIKYNSDDQMKEKCGNNNMIPETIDVFSNYFPEDQIVLYNSLIRKTSSQIQIKTKKTDESETYFEAISQHKFKLYYYYQIDFKETQDYKCLLKYYIMEIEKYEMLNKKIISEIKTINDKIKIINSENNIIIGSIIVYKENIQKIKDEIIKKQ